MPFGQTSALLLQDTYRIHAHLEGHLSADDLVYGGKKAARV